MNAKFETLEKPAVANPGSIHCSKAKKGFLVTLGFEGNFFNRSEVRLRAAGFTGGTELNDEVFGFEDFITRCTNGAYINHPISGEPIDEKSRLVEIAGS